jgi:hypothetical protein
MSIKVYIVKCTANREKVSLFVTRETKNRPLTHSHPFYSFSSVRACNSSNCIKVGPLLISICFYNLFVLLCQKLCSFSLFVFKCYYHISSNYTFSLHDVTLTLKEPKIKNQSFFRF